MSNHFNFDSDDDFVVDSFSSVNVKALNDTFVCVKENRNKQIHAAKEFRRLQKRRHTRQSKLKATNNALDSQAVIEDFNTRKSALASLNELSADNELRLRLEKILNRQAAKRALQLERKLKSKRTDERIRKEANKKQAMHFKRSVNVLKNE